MEWWKLIANQATRLGFKKQNICFGDNVIGQTISTFTVKQLKVPRRFHILPPLPHWCLQKQPLQQKGTWTYKVGPY